MMLKVLQISCIIFVIAVLRIQWKALVLEYVALAGQGFRRLISLKFKSSFSRPHFRQKRRRTRGARSFADEFLKHFHPDSGLFQDDPVLRKRVYAELIDIVREGKTYKSMYRKIAGALHPNSAPHSRLLYDELDILFKYFQNHFTHPDDFKS